MVYVFIVEKKKATIEIDNPNFDKTNKWKVCETCKEVISIQQELSFLSISKIDNPKRAIELNNRLLEISKKTGKPIMNVELNKTDKGYSSNSINFGE